MYARLFMVYLTFKWIHNCLKYFALIGQRIAQRKFPLRDSLSPNQKCHLTFWIKFGLSPKFGLSERQIRQVKSRSE